MDYKDQIKKLSPASRKKFSIIIDHIIEIIETSLDKSKFKFTKLHDPDFPIEQQKEIIFILEKWGILGSPNELNEGYIKFHLGNIEELVMVASLETLNQTRRLFSEINLEDDNNITKIPKSFNKKELKKLLGKALETRNLGAKEKAFIKTLSDFKPHETKTFKNDVGTKDYKKLKQRVQKKLKGTSFCIKTIKGGTFKPSYYQLEYVFNSEK